MSGNRDFRELGRQGVMVSACQAGVHKYKVVQIPGCQQLVVSGFWGVSSCGGCGHICLCFCFPKSTETGGLQEQEEIIITTFEFKP